MLGTTSLFNVHTLASYLHTFDEELSPVRLHKSLYFLFKSYGSFYGKKPELGVFEGSIDCPPLLFEASFEAWKFGPVIPSVYELQDKDIYSDSINMEHASLEVSLYAEIKQFIDEMMLEMFEYSEFTLIEHSLHDEDWQDAYKSGPRKVMFS